VIAVVEPGDMIEIDLPNRRIHLDVPDEVIQERLAKWQEPEPKVKGGYLRRYARLVTSASTGAVLREI
jgi:dihydroxy-acid dehydratase